MKPYSSVDDIDFKITALPRVSPPDRVLMADPRHFRIAYAINDHMQSRAGVLNKVDPARALAQWEAVKRAFETLGFPVDVLEPLPGQPDLVFCANQVLPILRSAADPVARVVASNMTHPERRGEVPHVAAFLAAHGVQVDALTGPAFFEGTGDGLWHPGRRLLWAGHGFRSSPEAWREVAARYELRTILLRLVDRAFYHLDTCFALLDEATCLWVPSAFDDGGRRLVEALVPRRIVADEHEARTLLACNVACPDATHVLIQKRAAKTRRALNDAGYTVIELETDEFLKAGGSVFCLKLLYGPSAEIAGQGTATRGHGN